MENMNLNGERIPNGLVNLYTIKIDDRYGSETITFSSNVDYDYEELKTYIENLSNKAEDADELVDNIKLELGFWYTEEYKPIEVKILDHNIGYCPYCGNEVSGYSLEDAYAECGECNTKFSTRFKGWVRGGVDLPS